MLEVTDLFKTYASASGPIDVLRGVSFRLAPGGRMVVMGPSGSGKSTLLSILGTLDEPTSARVVPLRGPPSVSGRSVLCFKNITCSMAAAPWTTSWCRPWLAVAFPPLWNSALGGCSIESVWPNVMRTFPGLSPVGNGSGWLWRGRWCSLPG